MTHIVLTVDQDSLHHPEEQTHSQETAIRKTYKTRYKPVKKTLWASIG
jgi:hypothetical protein